MPDAEATLPAATIIRKTIRTLIARRGGAATEVLPESTLTGELALDSLELAELSAVLEDELGSDPFSEGIVPETVAELIAFYDS